MTATQKKVAELNTIESIVREWQRGAISQRERDFRLSNHLTAEQIADLNRRVHRTTERANLAQTIATVIGL